jgi:tRNA threonylcarbamoyladenosine biosynthesis protein TsaB
VSLILNIETATKNCSVTISDKDQLIDVLEYADEGYSHAEKLHVFIDEILKRNNIPAQQLNAIAVSKGPGSYTGLRIGVSAAKGLCYALDIPLISISTLLVLAREIKTRDGYIIPIIDARRMEVYSAVYDTNYQLVRDVKADLLDQNPFNEFIKEKRVHFVGDAVEKTQKIIVNKHAVFNTVKYPSAKNMIIPAYQKYINKQFEDIAYFEPYYLKDFIVTKKKNISI